MTEEIHRLKESHFPRGSAGRNAESLKIVAPNAVTSRAEVRVETP